ncbi:MAG: gamma-glutamylcyclotransferase [Pseudomonadota bacterium]|nr:gamma-glutamylcyclotransferase [Pseudomonadota bacterium]
MHNIFFYGTLIAGNANAAAQAVHARLRMVGQASVIGALWAIPDTAGWYPALVAGHGRVHGVLYAAADGFGPEDLARLDAWEEYHPDNPADSLYLRIEAQAVDVAGVSLAAQLYRFNQPLPDGALAIVDGDFPSWLTTQGYTAYGC